MSSGGGNAPAPLDYYQLTAGELTAKANLAPKVYATEAQFDPQYTDLSLSNLHDSLFGTAGGTRQINYTDTVQGYRNSQTGEFSTTLPTTVTNDHHGTHNPDGTVTFGANPWLPFDEQIQRTKQVHTGPTEGYLGMAADALPQLGAMNAAANTQAREANINDLMTMGPDALKAMQQSDPETAKLIESMTQSAQQGVDAGTSLDAGQMRLVQQSVRSGQAARGMGYGSADTYGEALGVSQFGQDLKQQRLTNASNVAGLRSGIYGNMVNQLTGSQSQVNPMSYLQQGYGISSSAGPRLFGTDMNAQNVANFNANSAQAQYISNQNNAAAQNSAYIQGGVSLAAAGIMAAALA